MTDLNYPGLDAFLRSVLDEDIGSGDITTICCVPESAVSKGTFVAKEPGVVCGLGVLKRVFELIDDTVCVSLLVSDGDVVDTGSDIVKISGPSHAILTGERTALNLLQHMSGIATRTAMAVREVSGTKAKILDTRKTTPGLRALEKYAVKCGGGTNHRFNLADGVLIKDNHIKAAGSITNAIRSIRDKVASETVSPLETEPARGSDLTSQHRNGSARGSFQAEELSRSPRQIKPIEVETETLEQIKEAVTAGADIIMLDNMSAQMMSEAVKIIDGSALTEASGNMGERNLREIAETGVDYISIGALTHSVKALDISLKFD